MQGGRRQRVTTIGVCPDWYKTQKLCSEAVDIEPLSLEYVPDHFKTQEMRDKAVVRNPRMMLFVPGQYKTQEMCDMVMCINPAVFFHIPDRFKTKETWNKAVCIEPLSLVLFLTVLRLKKCVIKQRRESAFICSVFLIGS